MAYSDVREAVIVFEAVMAAGFVVAFLALACALKKKKDQRSKIGLVLSFFGALPATWLILSEYESIGVGQIDRYDLLFLSALPISVTAFLLSAKIDHTKNENGA